MCNNPIVGRDTARDIVERKDERWSVCLSTQLVQIGSAECVSPTLIWSLWLGRSVSRTPLLRSHSQADKLGSLTLVSQSVGGVRVHAACRKNTQSGLPFLCLDWAGE